MRTERQILSEGKLLSHEGSPQPAFQRRRLLGATGDRSLPSGPGPCPGLRVFLVPRRAQCAVLPVPRVPSLPELRAGEIPDVLARPEPSLCHEGSRRHGTYLSAVC